MFLLTEEMGELVQAIRRSQGKRWGHPNEDGKSREALTEEIGDILFLLGRMSLALDTDLGAAASSVLKKIESRSTQGG